MPNDTKHTAPTGKEVTEYDLQDYGKPTTPIWGLHNIKEVLATQPRRPLNEREEFLNMLFGADNDGEWMTAAEWRANFGESASD